MKTLWWTSLLVALAATTASADGIAYSYDWNRGDSNVNNRAGTFENVSTTYNTRSHRFQWSATFSKNRGKTPKGFTLAVNTGPNPKGHKNELALLYFDASKRRPILTAYNYNGENTQTSWRGGDRLGSSLADSSWINSLTYQRNRDGSVTLGFDIDAGGINSANGHSDWTGIGFNEKIGVWFHPTSRMQTRYDRAGYLKKWQINQRYHGWMDFSNGDAKTHPVPEPSSMALGLLGLLGLAGARRRKRGEEAEAEVA